jgi:hypothetical protein
MVGLDLGGVPREQKVLKGHLPRVIYKRVYNCIRSLKVLKEPESARTDLVVVVVFPEREARVVVHLLPPRVLPPHASV